MIEILFISVVFYILYLILGIIFPPWNFPKNIPTIPFYVSFLTTIFDMDQIDLFERYIREPMDKYGAVKIYFASRWNILISKPEYLSEIFRDEDTFSKSGNQKKIPYSVLAKYTGENIISAHGAIWKKFRIALTPGLQFFDSIPFKENSIKFIKLIEDELDKNEGSILISPFIQRLSLANICQVVLGFDIGTLTSTETSNLHLQLQNVKEQIFQPLYMNFPFLDMLPIPSRVRAIKSVDNFRQALIERVKDELMYNYKYEQTSYAASNLIRLFVNEEITETQLVDNIVILTIAGHENPQLLLTTVIYMLGKYPSWQEKLRQKTKDLDINSLNRSFYLNQFIFECIRIFPPLGQIINRLTTKDCVLGGKIVIPKNSYVGYNVYGTGTSKNVWGQDSFEFQPERWGTTHEQVIETWKRTKNTCAMSAFHGGRRACLGEKLALIEIRITIANMLQRLSWKIDNDWKERVTSAGPICPFMLRLKFTKLSKNK